MNRTAAEEKAIALLGMNFLAAQVAAATGLTEGRISQIASDSGIAKEIAELRFQNLARHNETDRKADDLEDKLLDKLAQTSEYLMRPMEIARVYSLVNAAKRRGASNPETAQAQNPVVALTMPTLIINHFTKNVNNQVVQVGEQSLVTIQPAQLSNLYGLLVKRTEEAERIGAEETPRLEAPAVIGK